MDYEQIFSAAVRRAIDADVKRWGPVITRIGVKLD